MRESVVFPTIGAVKQGWITAMKDLPRFYLAVERRDSTTRARPTAVPR